MKFGKGLKRQIEETLPQWRDQFLSYKELKKLLRQISATPTSSEVEAEFVCLLDGELDKLNSFFGEQEEEFVIRQRELQERIQDIIVREAEFDDAEMGRIRKDIVDLHGEMVLLLNYSSINYTGLAKILKKYDKRTGALLRLPFIDKVLKQPFFETNLISALVKQCESTMDVVFPIPPGVEKRGGRREITTPEQSVLRSTIAALVTMRELRNGSSTYGRFSLPPMNLAKIDILESLQVASPIPIP